MVILVQNILTVILLLLVIWIILGSYIHQNQKHPDIGGPDSKSPKKIYNTRTELNFKIQKKKILERNNRTQTIPEYLCLTSSINK